MTPPSESRPRLILHVGTHKTGTSYLQKLFLDNRSVLEGESVALAQPVHEVLGDHHFLVSFLDAGEDGLERFLAGLENDHACTLLSSETMLTWLWMSKRAPALAAELSRRFDVCVVLYLRRQDYLKESVFAEVACSWYQGDIQGEKHYAYDYSLFVDRLVALFGVEALRLGIYWDDRPQDLAADFLSLCGLERLIPRLSVIPPQRVSADRRQVALLARCPKEDPLLLERLRSAVLSQGVLQPDPCKYQLSPEQRRAFLEPFIESNRRLAQAFRPDAERYLTAADPVAEVWSPPAPYSAEEVSALLVALAQPAP
jgi:hypothetical protein